MRLKIHKMFRYIEGAATVELPRGVYDVPREVSRDVADKAIKWGSAELLIEKKVPENKKRDAVPANKAKMGKKPRNSGRTGSKPNK